MRSIAFAVMAATLFAAPAFAESAKPVAPPAAVKFAPVAPTAVLSYNLIGLTVVDGSNSTVGEIKDLIINDGKLTGYILSVGGFLGMGEHYVAVEPSSVGLTYDESAKKWVASVNATKDQLKAAPQFKYEGKFKH
ncbi:PRC-barrel domain-containing protein [Methylobacterium haplocladii]|uniref:PRC-barrel domain-containing protein n=1 Tax=Methylobacterium haplocladii TaxID=1176176 RepID=A0A512IPA3_9HYPH|nr:PRC-barrel domain-containing protein [Methylobacterium haplocladii]GEO99527.1 hypothetical protein MHA02_19150 [Methylobacterium haplocladii]GJD83670.1 hypothetical protein HPGCJGGD_1540 [Methylobacterium haplocladii]GLS59734.1 hypothetical protein GCM10007887_24060 [Methylobacterium haplocladii]